MRAAFFLFLAGFIGLLSGPAVAQSRRAPGVAPLDQILPEIRRTHPGRFYDADGPTPGADGSEHYHLKWMTPDGRIEWLDTDARTGRVLGVSPGRDNFDPPGAAPLYAPAPSYRIPPGYEQRFRDNEPDNERYNGRDNGRDNGRGNGYGGYPGGRAQGYGGPRDFNNGNGRGRGRDRDR